MIDAVNAGVVFRAHFRTGGPAMDVPAAAEEILQSLARELKARPQGARIAPED